VNYSESVVL